MAKASEGGISSTVMSWYDTLTNSVPDETIKGVLTGARGSVSSAVESTTTLTQNALSQVNSAVTAVMLPSCHALSTQALSPLVAIPLLSAATAVLWKMTRLRRSYSPSPPHPLHCHSLPLTSRLKVFHSMQMLTSGVAIGAAIMITKVLPADNSKDATTTAVSTTLDAIRKVAGLAPAAPVSLQREALSTALTATRRTLAVSVIPYLMHSIVTVYGTKEKEYSGLATRLLRTTHNASIIADVATALFVLNSTGVAPVIKLSSIGLLAAVEILVRGVGIPPQAGAKAIRGVLSSLGVATCLAALVTSRYGVNELGTSAALLRSMFLIGIASLNSRAHSLRTASIAEKRVTLPNVLGLNAAVALWILTWKSKGMCPMIQFGERTVPVAQLLAGAHLLGLGGALGALFFKREIRSLITSPPADPPQPKQTSPLSESWAKEFIFADS